jgi:hypothetical protein
MAAAKRLRCRHLACISRSRKAKRARAAASLRTSAAHVRWEQIQLDDVEPIIEFTRELMTAHLE